MQRIHVRDGGGRRDVTAESRHIPDLLAGEPAEHLHVGRDNLRVGADTHMVIGVARCWGTSVFQNPVLEEFFEVGEREASADAQDLVPESDTPPGKILFGGGLHSPEFEHLLHVRDVDEIEGVGVGVGDLQFFDPTFYVVSINVRRPVRGNGTRCNPPPARCNLPHLVAILPEFVDNSQLPRLPRARHRHLFNDFRPPHK